MQKAGDIVYEHPGVGNLNRGEERDLLADILLQIFADETAECTRLSNGAIADALYLAIDLLIVTDEQKATMQAVIAEALAE